MFLVQKKNCKKIRLPYYPLASGDAKGVKRKSFEAVLCHVVEVNKNQYGFLPRRPTMETIFAVRQMKKNYREAQKQLP